MTELFEDGSFRLADLLDERMLDELYAAGDIQSFGPGELIHSQGDADHGLSIILEGSVEFGTTDTAGEYIVNAVYGAGQSFGELGLFGLLIRPHSAVAIDATKICFVPTGKVDHILAGNSELAVALLKVVTKRLVIAVERLDEQRRWPTHVRLAKLLTSLAAGNTQNVRLKSSQSELAVMLGVSRVTVGLGLRTLTQKGLVKTEYGRVLVCDVAKLDQWVNLHVR